MFSHRPPKPPPSKKPQNPPPPEKPQWSSVQDSVNSASDVCFTLVMCALILLFFCIFPPVSILLIVLWIIAEIRNK